MTLGQSDFSTLSSKTLVLGGGFFLLSLFSGILGGAMALPIFRVHPTEGMLVSHAVFMTFFVMCPAVLGGLAQCCLPKILGCARTILPLASVLGWAVLASGALTLPFFPAGGLALWGLGILAVAFDVLATVLESRKIGFRDLPPLVWSLLAMVMALCVVAPVILALLAKGVAPLQIIQQLRLPEMSLLLIPALGIVAQTFTVQSMPVTSLLKTVTPYSLMLMGLVGPLLWADMLFGGVPSSFSTVTVIAGQVVPGLCILFALCKDSWSYSLNHSAAVLWSFGAIILLTLGWVAMLFPHTLSWGFPADVSFKGTGGEFGHQAGVFGALMALSGAFYTWSSRQLSVRSLWYEGAGCVHAGITFIGAVCSFFPQWEAAATFIMTASLLGYVCLGATAWQRALTACFKVASLSAVKKG